MKKSIYPVLVLILVALVLAGCRGGSATNTTAATTVPATTAGNTIPSENTTAPQNTSAPANGNGSATETTIDNGNGPLETGAAGHNGHGRHGPVCVRPQPELPAHELLLRADRRADRGQAAQEDPQQAAALRGHLRAFARLYAELDRRNGAFGRRFMLS